MPPGRKRKGAWDKFPSKDVGVTQERQNRKMLDQFQPENIAVP